MFGARAAQHAVQFVKGSDDGNEAACQRIGEEEAGRIANLRGKQKGGEKLAHIRRELVATMESGCGVYREQASMDETARTTGQLKGRFADVALEDSSTVFNTELVAALELGNMLDVAEALAHSAADRKESRGAHTRKDHKHRDDQNYLYHTLCHFDPAGPRLSKKDVTLGVWEPEERKY